MKNITLYVLIVILSASPLLYAPVFTINHSGLVTLGSNLVAQNSNDSIIRISASEVTLDLGGYELMQAPGLTGVNGIEIDANVDNTIIRNGLIHNLTGTGIIINAGCEVVTIESILTDSCDVRGLAAIGTTANPILGLGLTDVNIINSCRGVGADYLVLLQNVLGFRFERVSLALSGISSNDITGLRAENCTVGQLIRTRSNGLTGAANVRGFDFSNVTNFTFDDCLAGNLIATQANALVIGYELRASSSCSGLTFNSCNSFGLTATVSGGRTIGYRIGFSCTENIFNDCIVFNNSSAGDGIGFDFESTMDNSMLACEGRFNQSLSGIARGCLISSSTNINLTNGSFNTQSALTSTSIGIHLLHSADCIFLRNGVASNAGVNDASSYGFLVVPPGSGATPPAGNNVFTQNIAVRNGRTTPVSGNQFSGFATNQQNVVATENVNSIGQPWTNPGFI